MVQGIIQSLKGKCRSLAVKKPIHALEKGNQMSKFSTLTATSMLIKAWNSIRDGTFTNSFKKSGVSGKSMEKALYDEDDPFASLDVEEDVMESLKDDIEMMKEKFHENYGMAAEELVDIVLRSLALAHHLLRTSLQKFLDMLISTMKMNPMMKGKQLIVFRNQPSTT